MVEPVEEDVIQPRRKNKGKREADLKDLPIEVIVHTLSEEKLQDVFGTDGWKQLPDEIYKTHGKLPERKQYKSKRCLHYFLYSFSHIILIFICCLQKTSEFFKELINIKWNRTANMNQFILRLFKAFFCHKFLFKKLLTRSESSSCQDRNNFFQKNSHKTMNYCITLKKAQKKSFRFLRNPFFNINLTFYQPIISFCFAKHSEINFSALKSNSTVLIV